MKAKRWLVLAVGAMLVMNVSAQGARRFEGKGKAKQFKMEQKMVRCDRCGKMIDLRKEAKFQEFRKGEFKRGDFRGQEFKKHHRHHGRR